MKASLNAKDLKRIIMATIGFVGENNRNSAMQYVRLEFSKEFSKVTAVAVDGYALSIENAVCANVDEDFTTYIKSNIPAFKSKYATAVIEVKDKICFIGIGGCITGYKQPDGEFLDYKPVISSAEKDSPALRIGFNGNLLLQALQAAKISAGDSFKQPVVLEFRGALEPVFLRTNKEDLKLVLPMRIRGES